MRGLQERLSLLVSYVKEGAGPFCFGAFVKEQGSDVFLVIMLG